MSVTPGPKYRGWHYDAANNRLSVRFNGTEVFDFDANDMAISQALTTLGITATGAISATTTVTGGTGVTATTGNVTSTAGNLVATVGSAKLGSPAVFATTQGQGIVHMGGTSLSGIAPVGATATSGAVFASNTVVRKIIADSTASNVET